MARNVRKAGALQNAQLHSHQWRDRLLQGSRRIFQMHRLLPERLSHHAIARQLVTVPLDQNHGIQSAAINLMQRAFDDEPRAGRRVHDLHDSLNIH